MESHQDAGSVFLNSAARFLEEGEEEENKGFNPKQIIHAIGFMLAGISIMGLLYMCLKMIEFFNKQKRIQVVQKTHAFESRDNIEIGQPK